jgi:hypothetical protein
MRMRKEKSVENIDKHLVSIQKRARLRVFIFLTCLWFYLCIKKHILTPIILNFLFPMLLYICYRIMKMI